MEVQRIPLQVLQNTRDLGGIETADGRRIKARRLIRSGELSRLSPDDQAVLLGKYQLKSVIDFRTAVERAQRPDPALPGVQAVWIPIFEDETLGITRSDTASDQIPDFLCSADAATHYIAGIYRSVATNTFAMKQYAAFFDRLLQQTAGSVLWHCSAGKDRVGVATALLLSALGVGRERILDDFLATNTFTEAQTARTLEVLKQRGAPSGIIDGLRTLLSVQPQFLTGVFEEIEATYGSMDHFLEHQMRLTPARRKMLQDLYLEAEVAN